MLIPKSKNIWIFGSWFGKSYSDNSRWLFEYLNKNHPEIRIIWLTNNDDVLSLLKKSDLEVYKIYSIRSIYFSMKARYVCVSQGVLSDTMPFLSMSGSKLIQLWHGTPIKKIGYDDKLIIQNLYKDKIKKIIFPFLSVRYDLICSSSQANKINFTSAFKSENVFITGYPRNDNLFNSNKNSDFVITYLPTFRDNINDKIDLFTGFEFDFEKWKETLLHYKINLKIKMHPVNKPKEDILLKYNDSEVIEFIEEIDVAEILPSTDVLITDYSSVYFDFLLTDRPIIFAPFDYDKYITKDREFYYGYNEVTPGPKCKNWAEVLEWVVKFKDNPELYKEERKRIKDKFHKYQDGNSCERVYKEIIKL